MWPNHRRKSFKHFILELAKDSHYLLEKVSKRDDFDYETMLKKWKREIISARKERYCTKDQARDAWEVITGLDDYSGSPDIMLMRICDSKAINDIWEEPWYMFEIDWNYSPQALAFAHEVMPMFADILKKEIEDIKNASAATEAENKNSQIKYTPDDSKIESFFDHRMAEELLKNESEELKCQQI